MKYTAILCVCFTLILSLMGCRRPIQTELPVVPPEVLASLPGSFVYRIYSTDCSNENDICIRYTPSTGKKEKLSTEQMQVYTQQYEAQIKADHKNAKGKIFSISPNHQFRLEWIKGFEAFRKDGNFSPTVAPFSDENLGIVNQQTGEARLLNLDYYSVGGLTNEQWAPDSSYVLYSLDYITSTGNFLEEETSDSLYLFVIQNTKTGQAYRLHQEPQFATVIYWAR